MLAVSLSVAPVAGSMQPQSGADDPDGAADFADVFHESSAPLAHPSTIEAEITEPGEAADTYRSAMSTEGGEAQQFAALTSGVLPLMPFRGASALPAEPGRVALLNLDTPPLPLTLGQVPSSDPPTPVTPVTDGVDAVTPGEGSASRPGQQAHPGPSIGPDAAPPAAAPVTESPDLPDAANALTRGTPRTDPSPDILSRGLPESGLLVRTTVQEIPADAPAPRVKSRDVGAVPAYWQLRATPAAESAELTQVLAPTAPGSPMEGDLAIIAPPTEGAPALGASAPLELTVPQPSAVPTVTGGAAMATAAASADPSQMPGPTLPPTIARDLADIVSQRPDAPVELTLAPEELGRVRVTLWHEGDALRVAIQVERGETLELLRRNADVLMAEIRSAGFSDGTFSFSGWGRAPAGTPSPNPSPKGDENVQTGSAKPEMQPRLPLASGLDLRL